MHRGIGCPAAGKLCNVCKKIGHFAQVCRSRQQREVYTIQEDGHNEAVDGIEQEQLDELFIGELTSTDSDSGLCYKEVSVGDKQRITFKLDTGSEANVIPWAIYGQLDNKPALQRPRCRLITYSGHRISPRGETILGINGQPTKFQVVDNGSAILGKQACQNLNIIRLVDSVQEIDQQQHSREPATAAAGSRAQKTVKHYTDVFSGLGCIKTNAVIHVDSNVQPVVDPPRRIPYAIQDKVKCELKRMVDIGVIVKQEEPTEWVNSITIVQKPNKIRVCLDPTKLNAAIQ